MSVVAVAVAVALWSHEAGQTILQNTDWQSKSFETHLPQPTHSVPWLDLNVRTKQPKRDWPIGRQANALPQFQLHVPTDAQVSSNTALDMRRM
jgi:hypothetical protein